MKSANLILIPLAIQTYLLKNHYFKSLIKFSKNTARKHSNIIFSNSHTKYTQYFLNSKEIL